MQTILRPHKLTQHYFDINKAKFVPKITLPIITNFSSENFFNALRKI